MQEPTVIVTHIVDLDFQSLLSPSRLNPCSRNCNESRWSSDEHFPVFTISWRQEGRLTMQSCKPPTMQPLRAHYCSRAWKGLDLGAGHEPCSEVWRSENPTVFCIQKLAVPPLHTLIITLPFTENLSFYANQRVGCGGIFLISSYQNPVLLWFYFLWIMIKT
jgi:hypothetical protein